MIEPRGNKNEHMFDTGTVIRKVLEVLYKYPEKEFSLNDISREAGVAKANLGKIINLLATIGIVRIEKLANIWRIKSDQSSQRFLRSKITHNLNSIYETGVVDALDNIYHNPKSIILFGSFRKGEDISTSDIDIAVENDEFKKYKITGLKELAGFEKIIGRKIQIHEFNRKIIDRNLFNNIANGIVLAGFLEVNA